MRVLFARFGRVFEVNLFRAFQVRQSVAAGLVGGLRH